MSRAWKSRIDGAATRGVITASAAILSTLLMVTLAGLPVLAQKASPAAAKKEAGSASKADGASAQRDVEAGIKSLQDGKLEASVQQLSSALATGKLPSTQIARALYYRGLAYQRQSKPAQAIADFTSALWLKNGLDANQRADALQNRAAAYREAGLSDQADGDEKRAAAAPTSGNRSSQQVSSSFASAETSTPHSSGSGGIGSFFGNLFGGSSSQSESSAPTAKASAQNPAAAWSEATEVRRVEKTAATASPPAVTGSTAHEHSTAPERAPKPSPRVASAGGIHLQVATVRSLAEARNIAARLKQMGVSDTGGRVTAIEETTVGNMGTLYQVRVGPFANNDEPRLACAKIKSSGLDCLITPQ